MKTGIILGAATLLMAPFASFAATYNYVDTTGTVRAVDASSASQALTTAPNIASDSGVAVANGSVSGSVLGASTGPAGTSGSVLGASSGTYAYVNTSGVVQTVSAGSPEEALEAAPNIASDSGVTVYDGVVAPGVPANAQ